eukprot:gene26496-32020_t
MYIEVAGAWRFRGLKSLTLHKIAPRHSAFPTFFLHSEHRLLSGSWARRTLAGSAKAVAGDGDIIEAYVSYVKNFTPDPLEATYKQGYSIVKEKLPYIERSVETSAVVKYMRDRQSMRREEGPARNKMNNPLIAIPGSPGVGKSTFLAHFPNSAAYQQYLADLYQQKALPVRPPIVVPFTFNSDMGLGGVKDKPIVGLRMLYGAAVSMADNPYYKKYESGKELSFATFVDSFKHFSVADDALEASAVLRAVYGEERRLLLLVDEIIEALPAQLNDKGVSIGSAAAVTSIGELLSEDGETDVVLSSLSLPYVRELSGSKRQVQYVTMNPLLDSDLGKKETAKWCKSALKLGRKVGSGKVGQYTAKLLQSMYLLCSGYPRGVERLVRSYSDEESVESFSNMLEAKTKFSELLPELARKVYVITSMNDLAWGLYHEVFECVLSAKVRAVGDIDGTLRTMLEKGQVFLVKASEVKDQSSVRVSLQLGAFIWMLQNSDMSTSPISPAAKMAVELFKPLLGRKSSEAFSTWFERSVALTALVRSTQELELAKGVDVDPLSLRMITSSDEELKRAMAESSVLIVPPPNTMGFDLLVRSRADSLYLQCKSAKSTKTNDVEQVAHCLVNIIRFHVNQHCPHNADYTEALSPEELAKLKVVYYQWGYKLRVAKEAVKKQLGDMGLELNKADGQTKTVERLRAIRIAEVFVDQHFAENFHIVSGEDLNNWLLPVLVPIPRLVNAVEEEE